MKAGGTAATIIFPAIAASPIVDGLWQVSLGASNAFLIDDGALTLIDTGVPNSEGKIAAAIEDLNHTPSDIRHITAAPGLLRRRPGPLY